MARPLDAIRGPHYQHCMIEGIQFPVAYRRMGRTMDGRHTQARIEVPGVRNYR
jgi:hypothetical protein